MNSKLPLFVALALSLTQVSVSHAACTQAQVNAKTWKISATEITSNILFFCQFKTSAAGTIALSPNACEDSLIGVSVDFNDPARYDIQSGSIVLVPGQSCTYNVTLNLVDGSTIFTGRAVMESGKSIAAGNFLVDWGGGGSFSMMRQ